MSIFRALDARPHRYDDEPRICFVCLAECDSNETYDDCVRCPDCILEESKMKNESFDHIDEREARERIA
jgi:hypothetical protein